MTKIAFLGTGAMGSRMAARLCAEHDVTVWNRSEDRIPASLLSTGARPAATPADAADGADVVVAMVRDDTASRSVWLDGTLDAMAPGALAVECSTLSIAWIRELGRAAEDRTIRFCEAPVAGSRPQAEAGQLIHLVGGEPDTVAALAPILAITGDATHHLGPVGAGMAMKLIVNGLFGIQLAAIAELLALGESLGISPELALATLAATPILSPAGRISGEAMVGGQLRPGLPHRARRQGLGPDHGGGGLASGRSRDVRGRRSLP
ncbi:MAG: NAD(P)-binding domain-containing protein [Pseudomonadota bacterium]